MQDQQTIVVVEDDDGMRQALSRLLCGAGHAVTSFDCAEALLSGLEDMAVGEQGWCLVCDVRLPGISGFELHRRITDRGLHPACIFITAHDRPTAREQAAQIDCEYLVKPFEGRSLLALVEQVERPASRSNREAGMRS